MREHGGNEEYAASTFSGQPGSPGGLCPDEAPFLCQEHSSPRGAQCTGGRWVNAGFSRAIGPQSSQRPSWLVARRAKRQAVCRNCGEFPGKICALLYTRPISIGSPYNTPQVPAYSSIKASSCSIWPLLTLDLPSRSLDAGASARPLLSFLCYLQRFTAYPQRCMKPPTLNIKKISIRVNIPLRRSDRES
jgi:hypothetical protein